MSRITATTVPVAHVSAAERDAMWGVFARYYEDVTRAQFEADLAGKDHVILLWADGAIHGFSTVGVRPLRVGDRAVVSVYSGDTVIDRAWHGQTALQWAFFRYVLAARLRHPFQPVVWFLISKGYKTYLLLARNFATFWPRRDHATPAWEKALLDTLARDRFGAAYDAAAGVLRVAHGRLRADVAPVTGVDDPDVAFFVATNPNHAAGEELCCVGFVDAGFLLGFPLRVIRKLWRARAR